MRPLSLYEKMMLLALRDEKGTVAFESNHPYAIGGAILAELLLLERVRVTKPKRKKIVEAVSATPIGDPLLDECLERIVDAKRKATPQSWVARFSRIKRLKHRVAERLIERGVLRAEEGKILGIFPTKVYPEADPLPERELVEDLRRAIFTDTNEIEPSTVIAVSPAHRTDLLKMGFEKKRLKERKRRIREIVEGEVAGKAAGDAVEAAQAAVVAIMAASVATTSSS
jgi:hypothetical protein